MKAYTPETASGNTSSAVRTPQVASLKNSSLMGSTPMHTYGSGPSPSGNSHVDTSPHAFASPSPQLTSGGVGHVQHPEVRNPTNGIAHISMKP